MINRVQAVNNNYKQNFGKLRAESPQILPVIQTAIDFLGKLAKDTNHGNLGAIVQDAISAQIQAEELCTDILFQATDTKNGVQYSLKILGLDSIPKEILLGSSLPEKQASSWADAREKILEGISFLQNFTQGIFRVVQDENMFIETRAVRGTN